jgi:biopolymer transport protein ExbB
MRSQSGTNGRHYSSWKAHQIRARIISQVSANAERNLALIQDLCRAVPLLGLLGTVTGMIEVFEVMAISGSGNPRSMASGVSKATVPTMAGMVAALSGVAMSAYLENKARESANSSRRTSSRRPEPTGRHP